MLRVRSNPAPNLEQQSPEALSRQDGVDGDKVGRLCCLTRV